MRDDTKVILEQISANSQKNRLERGGGEEAGGEKDVDVAGEKGGLEREPTLKKNRFQRPQANPQERDSLLKRIESMRKDKKVYSRFEVLYRSRQEVCREEEGYRRGKREEELEGEEEDRGSVERSKYTPLLVMSRR